MRLFDEWWDNIEFERELYKKHPTLGIGGSLNMLYRAQISIVSPFSTKIEVIEGNPLPSRDHLLRSSAETTEELTNQVSSSGERWYS